MMPLRRNGIDLGPQLVKLGLLTLHRSFGIRRAIASFTRRWVEAEEALKKTGPVVEVAVRLPHVAPVLHRRQPMLEPDARVLDRIRHDALVPIPHFRSR